MSKNRDTKGSGNLDIVHYESIGSTNVTAKQMVRDGKPAPFCLVAKTQTDGVGRFGRKFYSPVGGLYMTVVLPASAFDCDVITTIIAKRLVKLIPGGTVKPINDILIDGKKVAGILVEKVKDTFVIGIGINLRQTAPVPEGLNMGFVNADIDINVLLDYLVK